MKNLLFFSVVTIVLPASVLASTPKTMSLDKVLVLAKLNSPGISASRFREIAAEKSVTLAKANYMPKFSAEAIDTTGFPASNGLLGVNGIMGSPFRSGLASGLVAEQTIWDFGRTHYQIETSKQEVKLKKQDTRITAYQVQALALQTYYECAFYKTQSRVWRHLSDESHVITREAQHFVTTGQVSVVDKYLSKEQNQEAQTAEAFFKAHLKQSIQKLSVIIGVPSNQIMCTTLPDQLTRSLNPNENIHNSPFLARAIARKKVAETELKESRTDFYPKIVGMASYGEMENARLVQKNDYAAGVGVVWPFGDFHTYEKIERAHAELDAKNEDVAANKQYLLEMNRKYDEVIESSRVRLMHLDQEYQLSNKAFHVAKHRYFSMEGDLIDLREAFRNLARVETDINQTHAQYLQASGAKALLNGSGDGVS